jgi:hypothetical protein
VSGDTYIIYPSSDGRVSRTGANENIATIVAGAGTEIVTTSNLSLSLLASSTSNQYATSRQYIVVFNGSSIPDTDTIISATLRMYGGGANGGTLSTANLGIALTGVLPTNNASLAKEDYNKFTSTYYSDIIPYGSWNINSNNNFTLNPDGLSSINKIGLFAIGMRYTWHINQTSVPWTSGQYRTTNYVPVSYTGNTYDPYLEIITTSPDTTPPASITNLTNSTTTCEQITFDWDNPTDQDFNGTEYWLNDVKGSNITSEMGSWILFGGLTGGTSYTFSTRTYDTTGNANATFVNMTATPASCGAAPIVNFTADNTSVCIGDPIWFNDTSEYTPAGAYDDYFEWDFGDGNTTAGYRTDGYNSPTYNYSFAGNKTVILTVTNKYGSDNETKVDYIEVTDCSLTADFTANQTCVIGIPADIQFNSSCDNLTYKNHWDFGTGDTNDDDQNPLYSYLNYGVFNVTHTCKINTTTTLEETKLDYITVGVNGTYCTAPSGNCTTGDYRPAYAFPSTEVVTIGFLGICGILVVGLIGRKE